MKLKSVNVVSFLLLVIAISSCNFTLGPNEFEGYRNDMRTRKSISYSVSIKTWSSVNVDTMRSEEFVAMSKIPGDTFLGGKIYTKTEYGEKYYDGSYIYIHDKDSTSLQKWELANNGIYEILGTTAAKGILFDFLDTTLWVFNNRSFSSKSVLDNHTQTLTLFRLDTANGNKADITYTFKERDSIPLKIIFHKSSPGTNSYRQLTFKDVRYNAETEKYSKELLNKGYPVVPSKREAPKLMQLPNGAKPGPIQGTNAQTGKPFLSSELNGKVVLVDFWFIGCSGCMEAAPHLDNLRKKYPANKLAIISIDPFDTSLEGVQKYITEKGISTTVVCAPKSILNNYVANLFPTFYVLDKTGTVVYSEAGVGKEGFEERFSKIIENHF